MVNKYIIICSIALFAGGCGIILEPPVDSGRLSPEQGSLKEVCPAPVECEICEVCPEPVCPDDESPWVVICHVPNSGKAHTIKVGEGALDAHLGNHGEDYLGSCE